MVGGWFLKDRIQVAGNPSIRYFVAMSKTLKVDLHDIFNRGEKIDHALETAIADAVAKKIRCVEIIHGKGSGQLKKRVIRFLNRKDIKSQYHRVEKDSKNFGRLFVHFRF